MSRRTTLAVICVLGTVLALVSPVGPFTPAAKADVTTGAKDSARTGWYPDQTNLSPGLVGGGSFGQQFSATVDGQVYAQPLVAANTLLVATETNNIYGLDPADGSRRWTRNLGPPWNPADLGCADLTPSIGVTATPVVDPASGTMYLTSKTYASGTSGAAVWYLHAVDVATGAERAHFPVVIQGTASNDPSQTFDPTKQMQRPGLLLMNGVIYAGFGGLCDIGNYSGWVAGVSTTGAMTTMWSSTDKAGGSAGIWSPGGGLASDGPGQILLATGNGDIPTVPTAGKTPPAGLGEAVVRLSVQTNGSLKATDYFAPYDSASLNTWDGDLGSGGPLALPAQFGTTAHPHLLVEVGKQGYVYLLDRDNLGGMGQGVSGGDAVLGRVGPDGGVWGKPTPWPGDGGYVYIVTASPGTSAGASSGVLHAYQYGLDGSGNPSLRLVGTSTSAFGLSSSSPVVTSNGTASGSALVWTVYAPGGTGTGAQLRAYNPIPVNGVMTLVKSWPIGTSSKFNSPAVDHNHVYVGTRDGHVLGFGSPVTTAMTGAAVAWPTTTVGQSSLKTATLTANAALTVTSAATSDPQFRLGTATPALPATLAAGATLSLPITFTPSSVGQQSATMQVDTDIGSVSVGLNGTGQSATASITASPASISFGGVAVGRSATAGAIFSNTGAQPLTVQSIATPSAPFSMQGMPAAGFVMAPNTSVSVGATFAPTANGTFVDQVSLVTSAGTVSIPMSGSAAAPPNLVITPITVDYGRVPVGAVATGSFKLTNTGGTPLTFTKSKPPVTGVGFTASTTLAEGSTIAAGASVTETVRFAPTVAGAATDAWVLNGNDASGVQTVTFTGTGAPGMTVPGPAAGGWTLNGTAAMVAGAVQLTDATTPKSAGSAFWPTPVSSSYLDVSFDSAIDSGTGADGLTLALADPKTATAKSLGGNGGGLGWSKIAGAAVALDTFASTSNPSNNTVGLVTGYQPTNPSVLTWAAIGTGVPPLRNTVRHIRVVVSVGYVTVYVDGHQVLTSGITLSPTVLLGFTGGDGGLTDRHVVSNVVITALAAAATAPDPPTAVTATAGDGQAQVSWAAPGNDGGTAITGYTVTGTPGGTTVAAASARTATVTGLTDGTAYSFTVRATNAAGTSVASTASAAVTPVAAPMKIPPPTAGGWQLNGATTLTAGGLELTNATAKAASGSAFWPTAITGATTVTAGFDSTIGSGTGGDGLTLAFADADAGATAKSRGVNGGGLGWSGIPGFAVALDTHKNGTDPSNSFIGVAIGFDSTATSNLVWTATTGTALLPLRTGVRHISVSIAAGVLTVSMDGTQLLTTAVALPKHLLIGFTGATGGLTDEHDVSNVVLTVS